MSLQLKYNGIPGYDGNSQNYSPAGSGDEEASISSSGDYNESQPHPPDLISQALDNMVKVCNLYSSEKIFQTNYR